MNGEQPQTPFTPQQELAVHALLDRMIKEHLDRSERSQRVGAWLVGSVSAAGIIGVVISAIIGLSRQSDLNDRFKTLEADLRRWETSLSGLKGEDSAGLIEKAKTIKAAWNLAEKETNLVKRLSDAEANFIEVKAKFVEKDAAEWMLDDRVAPLFYAFERFHRERGQPPNADSWMKPLISPAIRKYMKQYDELDTILKRSDIQYPWTDYRKK